MRSVWQMSLTCIDLSWYIVLAICVEREMRSVWQMSLTCIDLSWYIVLAI